MTQLSLTFTPDQLSTLNARFEKSHPREIICWAADTFENSGQAGSAGATSSGGLVMTSSFGADSMCTVHLATQVLPNIPIIVVNTGYLFPETLKFMEEMRARFGLNVQEFHTRNDPVVWLTVHGEPDPRVRQNVDACCAANKNEVFDRAMRTLAPAGWIRGVRADQSKDRAKMATVQWSHRTSSWAISPILRWSTRDVFEYMKKHDLPHHPLWEKGYTSIGCNPLTCTRAVGAEDDERSGRWAGSDKKECGINLDIGVDI